MRTLQFLSSLILVTGIGVFVLVIAMMTVIFAMIAVPILILPYSWYYYLRKQREVRYARKH